MDENLNNKLVWSALEYEEKDRSQDWFWALGIIVITSSIASIIFGNYFFAALLIISGLLLGYFAMKNPEIVTYELNTKGLKIHSRVYPYENIKSFWIQLGTSPEVNIKPILFVHTERAFLPELAIPINHEVAEDIYSIMTSQNIPEVEMKEHPSEKIMEVLGF
jgi:hypothetical protein